MRLRAWIVGKIYVAGRLAIAIAPFAVGAFGDRIGTDRSFWVRGIVAIAGLALSPVLNRRLRAQSAAG